jgi:hypothetical protein
MRMQHALFVEVPGSRLARIAARCSVLFAQLRS